MYMILGLGPDKGLTFSSRKNNELAFNEDNLNPAQRAAYEVAKVLGIADIYRRDFFLNIRECCFADLTLSALDPQVVGDDNPEDFPEVGHYEKELN